MWPDDPTGPRGARGAYGRPGTAYIVVIVPVLGRAERLGPLLDSINENTRSSHWTEFVLSPGDDAAIAAAAELPAVSTVMDWPPGRGDYAKKINHVARQTDTPWVFTGATDIEFTPGWDQVAFDAADPGTGVIGTRDECNPRTRDARHSTHSLVARWYIDRIGEVLHEGYWHNFVDDELLERARGLKAYRPSEAVVRHFHPLHHTAPDDDTYRLGQLHFDEDRRHWLRRRGRRFR